MGILFLFMVAGLADGFWRFGSGLLLRMEGWLCLWGLGCYLLLGVRLILRKKRPFVWTDVMEINLVVMAFYLFLLEYWLLPAQGKILGEENTGGIFLVLPWMVWIGWCLLGCRGARGMGLLFSGTLLSLCYVGIGIGWSLAGRMHPYFFFDPMAVGYRGMTGWVSGALMLLPMILLLAATVEYTLFVAVCKPDRWKKASGKNINGRGLTK